MSATQLERRGPVAIGKLANPPVNGLVGTVRAGVQAPFPEPLSDSTVRWIEFAGDRTMLRPGPDNREFVIPSLADVPGLPKLIASGRSDSQRGAPSLGVADEIAEGSLVDVAVARTTPLPQKLATERQRFTSFN